MTWWNAFWLPWRLGLAGGCAEEASWASWRLAAWCAVSPAHFRSSCTVRWYCWPTVSIEKNHQQTCINKHISQTKVWMAIIKMTFSVQILRSSMHLTILQSKSLKGQSILQFRTALFQNSQPFSRLKSHFLGQVTAKSQTQFEHFCDPQIWMRSGSGFKLTGFCIFLSLPIIFPFEISFLKVTLLTIIMKFLNFVRPWPKIQCFQNFARLPKKRKISPKLFRTGKSHLWFPKF